MTKVHIVKLTYLKMHMTTLSEKLLNKQMTEGVLKRLGIVHKIYNFKGVVEVNTLALNRNTELQ